MRRHKHYILTAVFIVSAFYAWCGGASAWVTIDKNGMAREMMTITRRFQHMKCYQVEVTHATYEDYMTSVPHQISKGYFKRYNNNYHDFLLGIQTIQDNGCRLVIDSSKKVMMVADPTNAMDSIMPVSDYTTLYGLCSSIKVLKEGSKVIYKLLFDKKSMMGEMDFTVQDSLPAKIVMYYNKEVKSGNMLTKPRLEIEYSNWKTKVSDMASAFDIQEYIAKRGNNYVIKTPYLASYKLLDERVLTRNDKK